MDTSQALSALGVSDSDISPELRKSLDEEGFAIIENLFDAEACERFRQEFDRLWSTEGADAGKEVHTEDGAIRISDIFNKSTAFDVCLVSGPILASSRHVLGEMKLCGANMREPFKGYGEQALHSDNPKRTRADWQLVNALIAFDDMGAENGAPRIVPRSHLGKPLMVNYPDPIDYEDETEEDRARMPADPTAPYPGEKVAALKAGSAVIINGALWHGGTRNRSGLRRRMLHLSFTRQDLDQQLDQSKYLTPYLEERLTPELRYLLDID